MVVPAAASATALPSTIKENMTLTPAGNPYTGTSTIESGVTVKIEAGVKLLVGTLTVKGTLKAEGTAEEPVVFTGAKAANPGEWRNIKFEAGSGASVLDHVEIAYGGETLNSGAVEITSPVSPTITHSTFRKNRYSAIKDEHGGSPEIGHDLFIENGTPYPNTAPAIAYWSSTTEPGEINIHDNTVEGGGAGFTISQSSKAGSGGTLGGNTIIGTAGTGLSYFGNDIPGNITENTLSGNKGNLISISGTVSHSSTWGKGGGAVNATEVTVASGVTLTITPGVVLIPFRSFLIKGTLKAEGTAEEPVVFTGAKAANPGEWRNIKFEAGSGASVLDHVEIAYGGETLNSGAVEITSPVSPTITHSTFRKNRYSAIKDEHGGSPEIGHDLFIENGTPYPNTAPAIAYWSSTTEPGEINIHDNTVEGGGAGFTISQSSKAGSGGTLGGNTIIGTAGTGLSYFGNDIPGNITENTLSGNKGNLISISGTVSHSSTWGKGGGAVNATEVTVASGVTLTITPGVVLIPFRSFLIKGTLKAEGTAEEPVVFTGAKAANPGEWRNIKFEAGSGASVLDHVEIAYGGETLNSGAVEITSPVSPTITHSTFRKNRYSAIKDEHGGSPEIGHDLFIENGTPYPNTAPAIAYWSSTTEPGEINIHDNTVEGGGAGFTISQSSKAGSGGTLGGNTIIGTAGTGLSYFGNDIPGNITENTLSGNKGNLISISGTVSHSSTWGKGGGAVNATEVTVASGVTLTITPGVVLIPFRSFLIKGTLKAEGTAEEPVVFTGAKAANPGEWRNIKFEAGSGASVLDHVEIAYGGETSGSGMIEAIGSHPTIKNSTIRKAKYYGILVTESGSPKIEWNRFRSNSNGISYSGTGSLSAANNDWGCANGPKPAGCGDSVTSNVSWKPAVQLPELAGHCRGKESQCGEGADPVSLATGQLDYSHRDLSLTNKSVEPLEFSRAYASGSSSDTGLGPGWSQTGLASAMELASGEVLVLRQDGRQDLFQKTETGYKAPSGVTDALAKVEGAFQLTTLGGTVYRFDSSGRIASITDSHSLKTTYAYNAEGRLSTITDSSSQTLTFAYNGSNHITSVKDSTGREVKFGYSVAGDLETVTDVLGGVTKYAYDSQHRLTSITDPRANVILKNVYDTQGRIVEQRDGLEHLWKLEYKPSETVVTEPEGGKLKYGFDGQDRVVSETDQLGHATTIGYDEAGTVYEVIKPGGAKWTYLHDAFGNLLSVLDPEGGEVEYEYSAKNRPTKFTDARGDTWSYEWSGAGDLLRIADPEEGETSFTYNESGQPLTVTDPNGHKTEFSYDSRGNRLTATDSLGHKTSFEYNSRSYMISTTAPGLKAESYERNALGDLLARTTPEGNKTKYAYDANGLPTQITDPGEDVWKIAYDAMERPTVYTDPLEQETKIAYDGNLKPIKVTNRRGKETIYGYDLANQLTEVDGPEGGDWEFGYDSRGNRTSVVDPRENETGYEYDLLNRMTTANEPLATTTEYGYDANGELTSVTDPRGNTTGYAFDKLGRLVEVAQPLGKTTTYTYDGVGDPLTKANAAGTIEYGYDAANRLISIGAGESTLRSFGYDAADRFTSAIDAESHKLEIGYDNDSRVTSIKDGRGQSLTRAFNSRGYLTKQIDGRGTLEYGYDKLGRLTSLTDPQSKALSFAYDPEGDLTEVKRPNGVTTTNVYDDAGRLAETTSKEELGSTLEALEYGYDPAGNVVNKFDARLEQETTFAYDVLNRITEFNPPGEGSTGYDYDEAGNRTEAGSTTYSYNVLNQLTSASNGTTYSYDGAGRVTGIEKGAEETTYEWDPLDHLVKAEGPSETATYAYDGLERLSERKSGEATQVTHYGDLTDLASYDANGEGEITTSYVQGARGLLEQRSGGTTDYPIADAHGDITAIAGPTGGLESRQTYDPWGVQLSGPSLEMGYLGAPERRADPVSGLIQMGERSYSASLGAFLSEDPVFGHVGISASVDRYLYVWDNPLNRYDLNGRDVCVPSPFGSACASEGLEDVATAVNEDLNTAEHVIDTVGSEVGSGLEPAWNWTAPGRTWIADRASDFWKEYGSPIESTYAFAGANWQYCREGAKTLAPGGAVVGAFFGPEGIPAGGYVGGVAGCLGAAGAGIALSAG